MRYCKKTKELIHSSYKSLYADEICWLIEDHGLKARSSVSIEKYINKLIEEDDRKELNRKKREEWALANPIKYRARTLVNGAKSRIRKRKKEQNITIPFDLTYDWVEKKLLDGYCEVTGTKFFIKPYSKRDDYISVHPFSPSLDQIAPSGGYTMDNVEVVCDQYNKMKGDRHITSAVKIARNLLREYHNKHQLKIKL